ncbi:MAG: DUF131 domain-containing protein [Thermoplasmata archaeon]|nr:DUF131 domain-containing protein [Thermoplasmata archaeon]
MIFFILGFGLILLAISSGEVKGGFFVVFPFLIGNGIYASLGILLIFLAFVMLIFGILESFKGEDFEIEPTEMPKKKVEGGGVVLIGPFPIVFGTNSRIALILIVLAIILTFLFLVIYLIASQSSAL